MADGANVLATPDTTAGGTSTVAPPQGIIPELSTLTNLITPTAAQAAPAATQVAPAAPHLSFLGGILDKVANVLGGGGDHVSVTTDPQGNVNITKSPATTGEKWGRIAAAALGGAAQGAAQGFGPAGPARALGAGFEFGMKLPGERQQQAEQQAAQEQQRITRNAQNAILHQNLIKAQFDNQAAPIEWGQKQFLSNLEFADQLSARGATQIGTIKTPQDITQLAQAVPSAMQDHMGEGGNMLAMLPTSQGTQVWSIPQPVAQQRITEPMTVTPLMQPDAKGTGMVPLQGTAYTFPKGTPLKDVITYQMGITDHNLKVDKATSEARKAELAPSGRVIPPIAMGGEPGQPTALVWPQSAQTPPVIQPIQGGYNRRLGTTAPEGQTPLGDIIGQQWGGGDPRSSFETNAQMLADGRLAPSQIPVRAGKGMPTKNDYEARADQIVRAAGDDRGYTAAQAEAEFKFANNIKSQAAFDGIDRIVGPNGQMNLLLNLAQKAIPNQGGIGGIIPEGLTAPLNRLEIEARARLGDTDANNYLTALQETTRSISGLMGNPLLGGGETDKKLEQAETMLGKNPTMSNIRSAANILDQALLTQRSALVGDNRFLKRRFGADPRDMSGAIPRTVTPTAPAATAPPVSTAPPPSIANDPTWSSDGRGNYQHWDGSKWAPAIPPMR